MLSLPMRAPCWFVRLAAIATVLTVHALAPVAASAQPGDRPDGDEGPEASALKLCQNLQPIHTLKGHLDTVTVLAKTSDDQTLLSGSEDGSIKLWDLKTGERKGVFYGHIGAIRAIHLAPDNRTVFSSTHDETLVWDLKTQDISDRLEGAIESLAVTPDLQVLFLRQNETLTGWNIDTQETLYTLETRGWTLKFSQDNSLFITSDSFPDKVVTVFELATGQIKYRLKLPDQVVDSGFRGRNLYLSDFALHPNNQHLLINLRTRRPQQSIVQIVDLSQDPEIPSTLHWDFDGNDQVFHSWNSQAVLDVENHSFLIQTGDAEPEFFQWRPEFREIQVIDIGPDEFGQKSAAPTRIQINGAVDLSPIEEGPFLGLYDSRTNQIDCVFPAIGLVGNLVHPQVLAIPDANQLIVVNNHRVEILDVSDVCTPKRADDYSHQVKELYENGIRQINDGVFEAAAITFSQLFDVSRQACDVKTQIEALFYMGESHFLIGDNMMGAGLRFSTTVPYRVVLGTAARESPLREQAANRLANSGPMDDEEGEMENYGDSRSISHLEDRLAHWTAQGDLLKVAHALRALGQAHHANTVGNDADDSYRQALDFLQRALAAYQALGHTSGQAAVYHDMGDLQRRTERYRDAIYAYQRAYQLYQQTGEREKIPLILLYLADMFYVLGDDEQALASYQEILSRCRDINGNCLNYNGQIFFFRSVSEVIEKIGDIYRSNQQYEMALDFLKQAASFGNMNALNHIGRVYAAQGQYAAALGAFQENATTPQSVLRCGGYGAPDRDDASIADSIRRRLSETEMTNAGFTGCINSGINSLLGQADVYRLSGKYSQAVEGYQSVLLAIVLSRSPSGNVLDQKAVAYTNMGVAYKELGDYDKALNAYNMALAIRQSTEDLLGQVILFNNIGEIYRNQGNYPEATTKYQQALKIAEPGLYPQQRASVFHNLGVVYDELGQPERALDYYQQALTLREAVNDQPGQSETLNNLGLVYQFLGDIDQAEQAYQSALSLQQDLGHQDGKASTLNNLALLYLAKDQPEPALGLLNQALAIYQDLNNPVGAGNTWDSLGTTYASLGRYADAEQAYQSALAILRETGSRAIERITLSNLGDLYQQWGVPELAILFYQQSVEVTEAIRQDLQRLSLTDQKVYTETVSDPYRSLVQLLLAAGRIPEAQQVLDLLKLEELREFTDTTRATWTGRELVYTDSEQAVLRFHDSLIALGGDVQTCKDTNCADLNVLLERLEALKRQYNTEVDTYVETIRTNRRDDEIFQNPDNLSGEAKDLLNAYTAEGEKAVLIYPFVLDDQLWLVWAAAGGVIGSVDVPVGQSMLATTVQQLGEQLKQPGNLVALQATSQQLYDWMIRPLERELMANDIDHLIFVNDRVTRYIPMAVLHDGDQFLLERYRISTALAPGLTDMSDRLTGINQSQVLGLGLTQAIGNFDPLPAVDEELDAIVRSDEADPKGIYPGQVFLNADFTLDALKTHVLNHRVLHMATHAAFVPGRADESFVVLGDGDTLTTSDIEALEDRLETLHLVVLSACQTALGGAAGDGTEIAGISSYFLEKGRAETVIASLWSVSDGSTSLLMQRFYELLASGALTKAEALRQAQLSFLYDEDAAARLAATRTATVTVETRDGRPLMDTGLAHPYHWAPFILIGNGL